MVYTARSHFCEFEIVRYKKKLMKFEMTRISKDSARTTYVFQNFELTLAVQEYASHTYDTTAQ
jgi:hypothetical protein